MPQAQHIRSDLFRLCAVQPGFLGVSVFGGVQPVHGREHTELHPAGVELGIAASEHMSADVVRPPCEPDIRRRRRKAGLQSQTAPAHESVSRKAYGIAVRAHSRVARQYERRAPVPARVEGVIVVEHPERVGVLHLGLGALLPVYPPKVHPVRLVGMVQDIEISRQKLGIGEVEFHRAAGCGVNAAGVRHRLVLLLVVAHSVARMQIECDGEPAFFEFREERLGIGEELPVEGVARPARALSGVVRLELLRDIVHDMPVHVHGRDGERQRAGGELVHEREILLRRVSVIARPPVAERELGEHGRIAGQREKFPEPAAVIVPEREKVEVSPARGTGMQHGVLADDAGLRIVVAGGAAARHDALPDLHKARGAVQRPRRAAEVVLRAGVRRADGRGAGCLQSLLAGAERSGRRDYLHALRVLGDFKGGTGCAAVQKALAGRVDKTLFGALFHAEYALGEHREPEIARRVDTLRGRRLGRDGEPPSDVFERLFGCRHSLPLLLS